MENIIIIVDSREKSNKHILDHFNKNNIKYRIEKLDFGDYSFVIDSISEFNTKEFSFKDKFAIERKASLEEISNNFSKDRERFKREFERGKAKMILMIEDSSYKDILRYNYKSRLVPNALKGSLHSFSNEYRNPFIFIDKECSGEFIYSSFYYFLRNNMKNN